MITYMKDLNAIAERYAIYQPIQALKFRKSDNDGFPRQVAAFKPFLRSSDHRVVKLTLSIFRSVEMMRIAPHHDLETVLRLPEYDEKVVEDIIKYIPKFVRQLKKLEHKDIHYHFTVKNGPNGPALATSDIDLLTVRQDVELYDALKVVSSKLKDKRFPDDDYIPKGKIGIHSKLSQFSEKSGKTRTIAIIDYYSQRALRPLHDGLMAILRAMPSDGTHSHNNVGNYAQDATKQKLFISTSDMTAFTDLFPGVLQKALLFELEKDKELATAWWTLLAKRTFTVAWSSELVRYGTGQPMGAHASWPLCTLAHHLIVYYSAYKTAQKAVAKQYRIIGDDNANINKILTAFYKLTLSQLGCELNPYKSTCSHAGSKHSGTEVAKKLYLNGINYSPLTPGLVQNLVKPLLLNSAIRELQESFDNDTTLPLRIYQSLYENSKISSKAKRLAWLLVTNPYDGVIRPAEVGSNNENLWAELESDREALYETAFQLRYEALMKQAGEVNSDPKGLKGFWVRLQNHDPKDLTTNFTGEDTETSTPPSLAVIYAAQNLKMRLNEAMSKVMQEAVNYNFDELSQAVKLSDVEYLPNPNNPFMDLKDIRRSRTSSLIERCFYRLSAEMETGDS